MATTPTNLPVPSESPRDLKFNAGKIDEFVTSLALQYIDRFGNAHYTIEGLKQLVLQQIYNLGFNTVGTFQDGGTVAGPGDILQDETNDVWYRWDDLSSLPKVVPVGSTPGSTGGIGEGKWLAVDISDVLRKQISDPDGATKYPSLQLARWRDEGDIRGWGAKCDGATDDAKAIRDAFASTPDIKFPKDSTTYVGSMIVTPRDFTITGNNSIVRGASGITIFQLPTYNGVVTGSIISGLHFAGVLCKAISVANDGAGSGFYRYIPRLSVRDCHVYWDLEYGIDGNLIFLDAFNISFGYIGDNPANKGNLKAIRSNATTGETNNPNFNRIRKCYFYNGSSVHPQIEWFRGGQLSIEDCDFEGAGQCIVTNNTYSINIEKCWFESCKGGDVTIKLNNVVTTAIITKSKLYRCGGTTGGFIGYNSTNMNSLTVSYCDFENESNYPLIDQSATGAAAIKLPSTNCIRWFDNRVINADPASAFTSTYQYRGPNSPRAYVRFNMSTGTVIASSVPVTLSKQSTGSYIISFTNYLGTTSTSNLGVTCSVFNGYSRVADGGGTTASQILVNAYQGGGTTIFDSTDVNIQII